MATRGQRTASISFANKGQHDSLALAPKTRHLSLIDNNMRPEIITIDDKKVIVKQRRFSIKCEGKANCVKIQQHPGKIKKIDDGRATKGAQSEEGKKLVPVPSKRNRKGSNASQKGKEERKKAHTKADCLGPKLPVGVINIDVEDGLYEYAAEVIVYLRQREAKYVLPPNFLEGGSTLPEMRAMLVDWLIQVQHHLNLCQETLYLTIAMVDAVLGKRDIDKMKLQLVGVTCLWMASKLEEYYPADNRKLVHLTSNSYTLGQIIKMELVILEILECQLYFPEIMSFLRRYLRAALRDRDVKFAETCQYLIDASIVDKAFSTIAPSKQAAASILATNVLFYSLVNEEEADPVMMWDKTLEHYTTYSLEDVIYTSKSMIKNVCESDSTYTGARNKYKSLSKHKSIVLAAHLTEPNLQKSLAWFKKIILS